MERLLTLIDGVNEDIKASQAIGNDLLIKQYHHLKKDYTSQLLELLKNYQLPIHLDEAA
ncbi:MAG: hypothetical protein R2824_03760 [Saprospiraceae bacterium]|nr:hypothetical protein [Lewinella sp.]